jgi:hypothetical protein
MAAAAADAEAHLDPRWAGECWLEDLSFSLGCGERSLQFLNLAMASGFGPGRCATKS